MNMKTTGALIACVILTACATAAQRQAESMDAGLEAAWQAEAACYAQARANPELARVLTYVVAGEDDPTKLQKLSDQRYLDEAMQKDFIRAQQQVLPCRTALKGQLAAIHPSYVQVAANKFAAEDRLILALLNGQLTIGQGNELYLELERLNSQAWAQANGGVGQELANAHATEMQQRQAAAMAMSQWSQQQQQQQQHQEMVNALNRPSTTNCRMSGNSLNCQSF